mgnify:CR=1 FL=1
MSSVIRNLVEIPSHNLVENYKTHNSIYVLVVKNVTVCEFFALRVLDRDKSLCYARKGHKSQTPLNLYSI